MRKIALLSILILSLFAEEIPIFNGTLSEIVIHGERDPITLISTIENNADQLQLHQESTVAEALNEIYGLDIVDGGKGEKHLSIRGFDQNTIKIMIDGVPASESYSGYYDLGQISSSSIKKLYVIRGVSSSLYGANSMGGVVNVITGVESGICGSYSISDFQTHKARISYAREFEKFSFDFSGEYAKSDGFSISGDFDESNATTGIESEYVEDGGIRELSDYEKVNSSLKLRYNNNQNRRYELAFRFDNADKGCTIESSRHWRFTKWMQYQISGGFEQIFNDKFNMNLTAYYMKHDDEITDDTELTASYGGRSWFDKSAYDNYTIGGRIMSQYKILNAHTLRAGIDLQRDFSAQKEYNARNRSGDVIVDGWGAQRDYSADNFSLAIQDFIAISGELSVDAGIAANAFFPQEASDMPVPDNIFEIDPQLSASWTIKPDQTLFISCGRKTRFPRLKELYSTHAGGNPNLKAENSLSVDAGGQFAIADNALRTNLFFNDVNDLITRERDNESNWIYINQGHTHLTGIEAAFNTNQLKMFSSRINFTYLYAYDIESQQHLHYRPEFKSNLHFLGAFDGNWDIDIWGNYLTGIREENLETGKTEILSSSYSLNLKVQKALYFGQNKSVIAINCNNLLDHDNYEGGGPMPGRSVTASISIERN